MKASKIVHNNEGRIMIDFPFNKGITSKIRQIPDARWSKTLRACHIPYTKEAYNQLIRLFPDIEITNSGIAKNIILTPEKERPVDKNEIAIEVSNKSIILKMPKDETDIQFIRTFKFVRWDKAQFRWVIPNYGKNLDLIKNYFNTRVTRIENRLLEKTKSILIVVPHETVSDLPQIDSGSLQEIERFKQWMEHKRYSDSTVKTYMQAITVFLRFIKPKMSAEATNEDMQRFVYQYMIPRKLSFSYQNQAVNAAKLFFKTIRGSVLITEQLERPRREHKLPNVLSKEEVAAILQALSNQKHRTMLA